MLMDIIGTSETNIQLASKEYFKIRFKTGNKRIATIHEYLINHYREEVDLKRLAALVSMAEGLLCRFFKMNTELTVFEYLNKIKAEFACKLLMDPDLSSMEICFDRGFNNISHFNKQFKKVTGVPLVEDRNLLISKQYGMIHPTTNTTKAVRGVFIIDPENIIQAIYFYPMKIERSTDELLRPLSALQATYSEKVMTPVNWKAGSDLLVPIPPKTDADKSATVPIGYYSPVWYLWYKKAIQ